MPSPTAPPPLPPSFFPASCLFLQSPLFLAVPPLASFWLTLLLLSRRKGGQPMLVVRLRAFVDTTSSLPAFPAARSHARMARPIVTGTSLPDRGLLAFSSFVFLRFLWRGWTMLLTWFPLLSRSCCTVLVLCWYLPSCTLFGLCRRHWVLDPPMPSSE